MRLVEDSRFDIKKYPNYKQTIYNRPEDKKAFMLRALQGFIEETVAESQLPKPINELVAELYNQLTDAEASPKTAAAYEKAIKDTRLEDIAKYVVDSWYDQIVEKENAEAEKEKEEDISKEQELSSEGAEVDAKAVVSNLRDIIVKNKEEINSIILGHLNKITAQDMDVQGNVRAFKVNVYLKRPEDITNADPNIWTDFEDAADIIGSVATYLVNLENYKFSDEDKFAYEITAWDMNADDNEKGHFMIGVAKRPWTEKELKDKERVEKHKAARKENIENVIKHAKALSKSFRGSRVKAQY